MTIIGKGLAVATFAAIIGTTPAQASELYYRWEKGKTYRFQAKSDETIEMSGMGIGMKERFLSDSTFSIKITKVAPDGKANGELSIEAFSITKPDGQKLAGLEGLPPTALVSLVEIDRKGGFKFQEEVFLVVDEESGENFLVTAQAGPNSTRATANDGHHEVTLWASFDPKTGQLSAGSTVKELSKPKKKQKKIKVRQDKPQVELLPTQFLALLQLPEGPIGAGGGELAVAHPQVAANVEMSAQILEQSAERVRLRTRMKTTTKTQVPTGPADEEEEQEDEPEGMPEMPAMPQMPGMEGLPQLGGKAPQGGSVSTDLSLDGEATIDFLTAAGMLSKVEGTVRSQTGVAGMMSIKTDAKLLLTRN
jgi:hypothetical protein